jgi:CO/xanthine dehydrogenase FAD-binding subunit
MVDFTYTSPQSLLETLALISEYQGRAKIIAGGSDLLAKMKKGLPMPEVLINVECVDELHYINHSSGKGLRIGAATSLSSLGKSDLILSKFPVLAQAINSMASPFLRNRATIGGNLCNAAPSADTVPALIVLGSKVKISGLDFEKVVRVEEFFTGPGQTVLKPGQMVTEIQVPDLSPGCSAVYLKQKRRNGADLAVVGVAALLTLGKDHETLKDVRIALGAVAPTPIRSRKAENILNGRKLTPEILIEAGKAAAAESSPIDDSRSSADYRKKLVAVMTRRAVAQAFETALSLPSVPPFLPLEKRD